MILQKIFTDERDIQVSGQSALMALKIYSLTASLIAAILYSSRSLNPSYEAVAITLLYSFCFLIFAYALIFKFHDRLLLTKRKALYCYIISVIVVAAAILTLRLFSGEDNWICQNGQWVAHGHPDFSAPTTVCR